MTTRKIYCPAKQGNWVCTLDDGHTGDHEAGGTGGYVHSQWAQESEPLRIKFLKYEPPVKMHSVLLTQEELKSVVYALAGEEWLEDEPELVKKFDKALKGAL